MAPLTAPGLRVAGTLRVPGDKSISHRSLIFSALAQGVSRVQNILKFLFPVPKEDSKRVMTFANDSDWISFRHHVFAKTQESVQLVEVGPRFEMKIYEIKLGTVEISQADSEWVSRPYQNTAKKRDML